MSATGRQLGEAWYMDYASGGLSEGERVLLDAHIEISDAASAIVADHEAVGGAYLDSLAANDHGDEDLPFSVESLFARMEADGEIRNLQSNVAAVDNVLHDICYNRYLCACIDLFSLKCKCCIDLFSLKCKCHTATRDIAK